MFDIVDEDAGDPNAAPEALEDCVESRGLATPLQTSPQNLTLEDIMADEISLGPDPSTIVRREKVEAASAV